MKQLLKTKKISVSDFVIKTSVLSSLFVWLLGNKASDFLTSITNLLIDPLFSFDLNNNGEPDLKDLEKFNIKLFGKKILVGKILLELIKLVFHMFVIYSIIFIAIKKTNFLSLK
jgi:hypothetical protein